MFKNVFKKSEKNQEPVKNNPVIAMVLLEDVIELSVEKLLKSYREKQKDLVKVQLKDNTITFELDKELGFISLMPAPVPLSDLEGPCTTAWYWKEAAQVLRQHKAHLIVGIMPQNNQKGVIERVVGVTEVVSSLLQSTNALGVYWGSGTVVQSRDNFIARSADISEDNLPYDLWIEFRIEMYPDRRCNIITTGMRAFGHMEIEIIKSAKNPMEVLEFVLNIVDYLMKNGPVIKDGDTIGEDEYQRIKVQYRNSIWDRDGKVMSINY